MSAIALIVGLVIWIPLSIFVSIVGGPFMTGPQFIGAIGPVFALGIPGLIRGGRSISMFVWAIALAPLLMILGVIVFFMLERGIFGNTYNPVGESVASVLSLGIWVILGGLLYWSDPVSSAQKDHDSSA